MAANAWGEIRVAAAALVARLRAELADAEKMLELASSHSRDEGATPVPVPVPVPTPAPVHVVPLAGTSSPPIQRGGISLRPGAGASAAPSSAGDGPLTGAEGPQTADRSPRGRPLSNPQIAAAMLATAGRPLHINEMARRARSEYGSQSSDSSFAGSIYRSAKSDSPIENLGKGMFGLRERGDEPSPLDTSNAQGTSSADR